VREKAAHHLHANAVSAQEAVRRQPQFQPQLLGAGPA
jgi:hypothetical protein